MKQFEAEAGIGIPSDYREFLLTVGNGGMGLCRLLRLSEWSCSYWIDDPKPAMVSLPCGVTPEAWEKGDSWLEKTNVLDWGKKWNDNEWSLMFGTIAIAEIGCGLFYSMVMTGHLRGRVFSWGDHALNSPCFNPEVTFGEWLDSLLNTMLDGHPVYFLDGRIR